MSTWQQLFEVVIVPMTGLLIIVYAALGGPVPQGLYPLLGGLLILPAAREADRRRRRKNGNGS